MQGIGGPWFMAAMKRKMLNSRLRTTNKRKNQIIKTKDRVMGVCKGAQKVLPPHQFVRGKERRLIRVSCGK
jgi:phosphoribosylformylglycinamidine (FGAM) synthase-like amidotransferase family enzyme